MAGTGQRFRGSKEKTENFKLKFSDASELPFTFSWNFPAVSQRFGFQLKEHARRTRTSSC